MARRRRKLPPTVRLPPFYRRHRVSLIVGAVLVALAVLGRGSGGRAIPASTPESDFERLHGRVFTVVKVVDGDTVDIAAADGRRATTRIRLWGVDTPEVATAPTGAMYWGEQASRFATETLLGGEVRVELVEGETRDKYNRLLAYLYLPDSGALFNELLLRGGHAYADHRFKHPFRERFAELERRAREEMVGLWREVTRRQMPGWRQKREPRR